MSLVTRLEDAIRDAIRQEIPQAREDQRTLLETRLVDLFIDYAAEHYKLVTKT